MAKIKSFTDLQQSKVLAEILPLESADMYFEKGIGDNYKDTFGNYADMRITENMLGIKTIPCWSLAALLEQIPYELCDDDGNSSYLQINKEDDVYQLVYEDPYGDFESVETDRYEHFVDACVEMVIKLKERNLI